MLDFFKELAGKVDVNAEEVTIFGNVVEENLYDFREIGFEYKAALFALHPELDIAHLEQFSFQLADGTTYRDDKFMLVFNDAANAVKRYPELCHITNPHSEWCLNAFVNSNGAYGVKFFDLDVDNYRLPELPPGSVFYPHVGIGQDTAGKYLGLYFGNVSNAIVSEFFNLPAPYIESLDSYITSDALKVYGITFDKQTLEVVKLKLYYYPNMETIEDVIYDELR